MSRRILQALGLAFQGPLALPPADPSPVEGEAPDGKPLIEAAAAQQVLEAASLMAHSPGRAGGRLATATTTTLRASGIEWNPGRRGPAAEAGLSQAADAAVTVRCLRRVQAAADPSLPAEALGLKRGREGVSSGHVDGPARVGSLNSAAGCRRAPDPGVADVPWDRSKSPQSRNHGGHLLLAAALSNLEDIEL